MADDSKTNNIRSNTLPSTSHPNLDIIEQHLQRVIKSFHGGPPSSHLSLSHQFSCLKALYESLGDTLRLQIYQKDLVYEKGGIKGAEVEEILEGSIMLLDMCGAIKDCYSQIKEGVKELESSLRRKGMGFGLGRYITSKKTLHKRARTCFRDIKKVKKYYVNMIRKDVSTPHDPFLNLIKRIQQSSMEMLQSCLSFISHAKSSRFKVLYGWSFVLPFFKAKKASGEDEIEGNLVDKIDLYLEQLMHKNRSSNSLKIQIVIKNMKLLELSIEDLEQELESVFRLLLRTRVYLLNNVKSCYF